MKLKDIRENDSNRLFPATTFPGIVRERRLLQELGVRALARRLSCSSSAIVKIEYGYGVPRPAFVDHLARELCIPVETLRVAADELRTARKGRKLISGRPIDLLSNLGDLPFVVDSLNAINSVAIRHGKSLTESFGIIQHLAAINGGFDALLTQAADFVHQSGGPASAAGELD